MFWGRKITKPIYARRKRIITEDREETKQMTSLMTNLNNRLSQKGNSIPFDNEYYFAISLASDFRSLLPRTRCLPKKKIQNIIFKHQCKQFW